MHGGRTEDAGSLKSCGRVIGVPPVTDQNRREGPFVGSRCLMASGGGWDLSEIKRVNEDGTFNVEAVNSTLFFLNLTYGVTAAELLFNDRDLWQECFDKISTAPEGLSLSDLITALEHAQYLTPPEKVAAFWSKYCREKLNLPEPADARLEADAAYDLLVAGGISATRLLQDGTACGEFKYGGGYYNAIRLGGRDPSEVARAVTLQDALEAWGVDECGPDPERSQAIERIERRKNIALPPPLRSFLCCAGIEEAISEHPLAPWLFRLDELTVRQAAEGLDGQYALGVLKREEYHYYAVFNEGDADARVYLLNTDRLYDGVGDDDLDDDAAPDDDDADLHGRHPAYIYDAKRYRRAITRTSAWRLTAPTVGMFFWDVGQTSLIWFQDTYKNLQFPRTDIGLKLTDEQRDIIAREESNLR